MAYSSSWIAVSYSGIAVQKKSGIPANYREIAFVVGDGRDCRTSGALARGQAQPVAADNLRNFEAAVARKIRSGKRPGLIAQMEDEVVFAEPA